LLIEQVHGLEDGRIVVGIDDGNGLARAVQRQVADAVRSADLDGVYTFAPALNVSRCVAEKLPVVAVRVGIPMSPS